MVGRKNDIIPLPTLPYDMDARILTAEPESAPATKNPGGWCKQPPGQEASGGSAPEAPQPHSTRPAPSPEGAAVDMRELKGLELAARCKITFDGEAWLVPSQGGSGKYKVLLSPDGDACLCEDFQLTK